MVEIEKENQSWSGPGRIVGQ